MGQLLLFVMIAMKLPWGYNIFTLPICISEYFPLFLWHWIDADMPASMLSLIVIAPATLMTIWVISTEMCRRLPTISLFPVNVLKKSKIYMTTISHDLYWITVYWPNTILIIARTNIFCLPESYINEDIVYSVKYRYVNVTTWLQIADLITRNAKWI